MFLKNGETGVQLSGVGLLNRSYKATGSALGLGVNGAFDLGGDVFYSFPDEGDGNVLTLSGAAGLHVPRGGGRHLRSGIIEGFYRYDNYISEFLREIDASYYWQTYGIGLALYAVEPASQYVDVVTFLRATHSFETITFKSADGFESEFDRNFTTYWFGVGVGVRNSQVGVLTLTPAVSYSEADYTIRLDLGYIFLL
jgi:hypothetical protein